MHLLNKAYDELRQRLVDADNKSKYDVLVQAKEYIQALACICERFDRQQQQLQHQQQQAKVVHSPSNTGKMEQIAPVDMSAKLANSTNQEQYVLKSGQIVYKRHLGHQQTTQANFSEAAIGTYTANR